MLSLTRIICVCSLVAFAFAENTFTSITASTNLSPGQPFVITWTTDSSPTVTLTLRQGDALDLETVGTIAVNIPNTGTYTWYPDSTPPAGTDYALEITGSDGDPNYSHYFGIGNSSAQSSSAAASASTTESASASSSLPASLVTDSTISMTSAAPGSAVTIVSGNSTYTSLSSASSGSSATSGSTTSSSSGTITSSATGSRTQSAASASSSHSVATNLISELVQGPGVITLIALSLSSMVFCMM